jgi:ribose transport system permease protein
MNMIEVSSDDKTAALYKRRHTWIPAAPPAFFGLVVLVALSWALRPVLLSPLLLAAIAKQAAPLGVVCIGQAMVMRCRSIDLSASGVIVAVVYLTTSGVIDLPPWLVISLSLLLAILSGVVSGAIVTLRRASAVIVTLAVAIVLTGVVLAFSQYREPGETPDILRSVGLSRVYGLPAAVIVWIAMVAPSAVLLRRTVFGKYLDAVGSNPVAASLSGMPTLWIIFIAHVASSLTAGIAALLLLSASSSGNTSLGQGLVMDSIAAVVLGGVTFGGGKGRIVGPTAGALMLTFLYSFLTSFGLGAAGQAMVQGIIIAVAAAAYAGRQR